MAASKAVVSVCALVGLLIGTAVAVNIETVPVGNPGNVADTTGFGRVDYSYSIGKYEVTAGQYAEFLNAVAKTDTYELYNTSMARTDYGSGISRSGSSGSYSYSTDAAFVDRPVNYVSFWDTCRFANWLHNGQGGADTETGAYTLTTDGIANNTVARNADWRWAVTSEDEWYKAAYCKGGSTSAGYWLYPTRNDTVPGNDISDPSGNNANYYNGSGPYPIDSPYYTTVAGEFQNSVSAYGTFDQAGNVHEWNETIDNNVRGVRGGTFNMANGSSGLASFSRGVDPATFESRIVGFRVVAVPEPATIALQALGIASILVRRRQPRA